MKKITQSPLLFVASLTLLACEDSDSVAPVDAGVDTTADVAMDADATESPDASDAPDADEVTVAPRPDPAEPGPYGVGYRRIETTYAIPVLGDERTIPISIWYPTEGEVDTPATYQRVLRRSEVALDGPVADTGAEMPLLVFSHGNESFADQSFFMTEHWASHGWVVAAMDHVGNNAFHDGDIGDAVFYLRPFDVTATLDAVYGLDEDEADPLHGAISDDVVMTGHSFGGYTTLAASGAGFNVVQLRAACDSPEGAGLGDALCDTLEGPLGDVIAEGIGDPRIDVSIPQTPAGAVIFAGRPGNDGIAEVEVPTMLMTAGLDETLPDSQEGAPIWASFVDSPHVRFHLPTAGHFTFSNMCTALRGALDGDGCSDDFIDPERAYELINVYGLSFARFHLWADEDAAQLLASAPPVELELTAR